MTSLTNPKACRQVAITFDDLPFARAPEQSSLEALSANAEVLEVLTHHGVPATGFVTESKITATPHGETLLQGWIKAGLSLGNHGASHADVNELETHQIRREIEDGERTLRSFPAFESETAKFFRFPLNHLGDTEAKKLAAQRMLEERGYRIAAATIDTSDYVFNEAYLRGRSDLEATRRIESEYLEFSRTLIKYYTALDERIWNRLIPEIIVLHLNSLNARCLERLIQVFRDQHFGFVSLAEAQADAAYDRTPEFVTRHGPMWGYRWARDMKVEVDGSLEPEPPEWIQTYTRTGTSSGSAA